MPTLFRSPKADIREGTQLGREPSLTDVVGLVGLNDRKRDEHPAFAGQKRALVAQYISR